MKLGNQRATTDLIRVSQPRIATSIYQLPSNKGYAARKKKAINIIRNPYNLTNSGFLITPEIVFINLLGTNSAGAQITKMINAIT